MAISTRVLSFTQPTKKILASENPIVFNLSSSIVDTNVKSKVRIDFISTSGVSSSFNLRIRLKDELTPLTHYEQTFYAREHPTASNDILCNVLKNENGSILGYPSPLEIASSLYSALAEDSIFNKYAYINQSGSSIFIVCKIPSENWTINLNAVGTSDDLNYRYDETYVALGSSSTDAGKLDKYSFYVDVYAPDTIADSQYVLDGSFDQSRFDRVSELKLPFNSITNKHQFNISDVTKSFLKTGRPSFVSKLMFNEVDYIKPFFVRYGECVEIPGTNKVTKLYKGSSNVFFACNASLDRSAVNDMSAYSGTSFAKILTNQPSIKHTTRDSKELVYLLIPKNYVTTGDSVVVTASVTYWDGTSDSSILLDESSSLLFFQSDGNFGGCYRINLSYDTIGLKENEETTGKKIKRVWFRIYKNYSEQLSDNIYYEYPYFENVNNDNFNLVFLNKLGGYDTFTCKGLQEEIIERSKDQLTVPIEINNNGSLAYGFKHNAMINVKTVKRIVVSTGLINKTTYDWLQELLSSNDVYQYNGSTEMNSLTLESHKSSENSQSNDYSIELTFMQTIYNNNVSI